MYKCRFEVKNMIIWVLLGMQNFEIIELNNTFSFLKKSHSRWFGIIYLNIMNNEGEFCAYFYSKTAIFSHIF